MAMVINSTARAMENMEYVRSLLEQRQPEFAGALEWAAMLAEKDSTEPTALIHDHQIRRPPWWRGRHHRMMRRASSTGQPCCTR